MDGLDGIIGPWSLLLHIIDSGPFSFALSLSRHKRGETRSWLEQRADTTSAPVYIYIGACTGPMDHYQSRSMSLLLDSLN